VFAGAAPLYGTWTASMFAACAKSAAVRCVGVPLPALAMSRLFGFERASATSSRSELACTEGCTTSTSMYEATSVIGVKSLSGSNGILSSSAELMTWFEALRSSV
jgi:hypothetical protein